MPLPPPTMYDMHAMLTSLTQENIPPQEVNPRDCQYEEQQSSQDGRTHKVYVTSFLPFCTKRRAQQYKNQGLRECIFNYRKLAHSLLLLLHHHIAPLRVCVKTYQVNTQVFETGWKKHGGGISNDFVDAIFELFVILAICTLAISRLYKLDFENTYNTFTS